MLYGGYQELLEHVLLLVLLLVTQEPPVVALSSMKSTCFNQMFANSKAEQVLW